MTRVFVGVGYGADDPYDSTAQQPNKQVRVESVCQAAIRRPDGAQRLLEQLLDRLRLKDIFHSLEASVENSVTHLRRALSNAGWDLSDEGYLSAHGPIDLETGGRAALDELLNRIFRSTDDPGLLLGTAKELLESPGKYVVEELSGTPLAGSPSFGNVMYLARNRLGLNPQDIALSLPGAAHIREVLQCSIKIAESINELRQDEGSGHGRTKASGVSPELAGLIIREACSQVKLMLDALDRQVGRRQ